MDARQYEKELKKAKNLQNEIDSHERERVMGRVITFPFRAAGWVIKIIITLVFLLVILGFIAVVIMYVKTGDLSFLDTWR